MLPQGKSKLSNQSILTRFKQCHEVLSRIMSTDRPLHLLMVWSIGLLYTFQNHLQQDSTIFSKMGSILTNFFLIISFLILPCFVWSLIRYNTHISTTLSLHTYHSISSLLPNIRSILHCKFYICPDSQAERKMKPMTKARNKILPPYNSALIRHFSVRRIWNNKTYKPKWIPGPIRTQETCIFACDIWL